MPLANSPEENEENLELPYKKRRSRILQALLFGVALASASPAFSQTTGPETKTIEEAKDQEIFKLLQQFPAMSLAHQKSISEVYQKASPDKKALMLQILAEPYSFPNADHGDYTLVIQQELVDLEEKGELAPKRKGGVILPADATHSGKDSNIEYSDDTIVDNEQPRITIENANAQQIAVWLNAMKDLVQWRRDLDQSSEPH